jgi:tetratricopeptide (TPR) repeat protein
MVGATFGRVADISASFTLDKMRSGNAAIYLLREQFERFASSPQRVDVCESIAHCFDQLEQYDDAGNWYEATGRLILALPTASTPLKALDALSEYEKALECYRKQEDDEKFTECSEMINQLRRACASS